MKNKKCSKCKTLKSISEFHKNKSKKDGYALWCKKCNNVYETARWKIKNLKEVNVKRRKYNKEHPELVRAAKLKQMFGITLADYNVMWNNQNGLCAICGKPEVATRNGVVKFLAVDHCHETGKIRALLCQTCNCILGYANDSVTRLMKLIDYLERYS